jgi:MoxR-like ATPase
MQTRNKKSPFCFQGRGESEELKEKLSEINPAGGIIGPWRRRAGEEGIPNGNSRGYPDHPANYRASGELVDAVNTSIAIGKPLLLTGNPGTGKSQLAERIAWEFNVGPVLRFEAQSLSEANDLFYRFDLLGHMAAAQLYRNAKENAVEGGKADLETLRSEMAAENYVKIGPLGEAILRSSPQTYPHHRLFNSVFRQEGRAEQAEARASVVLIDEIDKAARFSQ